MNINDIKAALASKAAGMHIQPILPQTATAAAAPANKTKSKARQNAAKTSANVTQPQTTATQVRADAAQAQPATAPATTKEAQAKSSQPAATPAPATTATKPKTSRTRKQTTATTAKSPTAASVTTLPTTEQATAAEQTSAQQTSTENTAPTKKPRRKTTKAATPETMDIEAIIASQLKAGIDYNTIPGLGRKPALLKAGAEHLAAIFGFRSTSTVTHRIEDLASSFVLYEVTTTLYNAQGETVAIGLGNCNSRERRYTRDFAGSLNTVMKMAKKRSYVDAVLTACHASGVFTQDIEDIGRDLQLAQKEA